MLYSVKKKLDRRNSIMAAVRKELKAHNAFIAPELLRKLAEELDTSAFYHIEVIRTLEEAAKRLRLVNHEWVRCQDSSSGVREQAEAIVGEVEFGEDRVVDGVGPGSYDDAESYNEDGDFDMNEPFVVEIYRKEWDDNDDGSRTYENTNTIVIYSPESIYDEEKYTAQKDAELNKLCQLRDNIPA